MKKKLKTYFKEFFQKLIITATLFDKNKLLSHVASSAFNFLLSIVPIFFMIIVVLVRVLDAAPTTLQILYNYFPDLSNYVSLDQIITTVLAQDSIGIFEIILSLSILWVARKLFASIQFALSTIYQRKAMRTILKDNLIPIAVEVVMVVIVATGLIAYTAFNEFLKLELASDFLSPLLLNALYFLSKMFPVLFLLIFCTYFYYNAPGKKPPLKKVFFSSFLCMASYFITRTIFKYFINMARYNLMYGILSNLIIALLSVYFFFMFFLFFAQFTYVNQFFDEQILTRIYLFQKEPYEGIFYKFDKYFFMEPYSLYRQYAKHLEPGEFIYKAKSEPSAIFFTFWGVIEEFEENSVGKKENQILIKGEVFGEIDCILQKPRKYSARALTEAVVLEIPSSVFKSIIHEHHSASEKIIKELSEYIREQLKLENEKNPLENEEKA